jgi:hypothetical protein
MRHACNIVTENPIKMFHLETVAYTLELTLIWILDKLGVRCGVHELAQNISNTCFCAHGNDNSPETFVFPSTAKNVKIRMYKTMTLPVVLYV